MSRGHKGVRQPVIKPLPDISLEVKDRTVQDLIGDLRQFQTYLDKIGAGAPRCIAYGCTRRVHKGIDPYYCGEHRPR